MKKPILLTLTFLIALILVFAAAASAQVVVVPATASLDFVSADNVAVIPAGQANAGQPAITSYQASVFPSAADPTAGTPTIVGPVIAKTLAVGNPAGTALRLTFAQMGITAVPACTVVTPALCPSFSVVLVAIGPNGTTARSVAAESDSFMRAALGSSPPAAPSLLKVVP